MRCIVLAGWVCALGAVGPAHADTVVLAPTADTTLFAASPDNSLGGSDTMVIGGTGHLQPGRGLLRFDVAGALPPGATVTSAQLTFTVVKAPAGGRGSTFHLHRMLRAWNEGRGSGNLGQPALEGDATWAHQSQPAGLWGAPGGKSGTDFQELPSGSIMVTNVQTFAIRSEGLAADVRSWLSNPSSNFGWMVRSDLENEALTARRVASRESTANPPFLTVDYSAIAPPVLLIWGVVGSQFQLVFRGDAGNIYEIQYRDSSDPAGAWQVRTNYIVKLVPRDVEFREELGVAPSRLFRVADVGDVD